MKYRLKKNFYDCPKGTEVEISDISTTHIYGGREIIWYNVIYEGRHIKLGNSETMNVDEWIEEVKPREWTLLKAHNGDIVNASEGFGGFYRPGNLAGISERIKVREVIE